MDDELHNKFIATQGGWPKYSVDEIADLVVCKRQEGGYAVEAIMRGREMIDDVDATFETLGVYGQKSVAQYVLRVITAFMQDKERRRGLLDLREYPNL